MGIVEYLIANQLLLSSAQMLVGIDNNEAIMSVEKIKCL
jgi:hypothetical protein